MEPSDDRPAGNDSTPLAGTVASAGKDLGLAPVKNHPRANPDGSRFASPLCLSALALAFRIIRGRNRRRNTRPRTGWGQAAAFSRSSRSDMTVRSISDVSRRLTGLTSVPNDAAADWMAPNCPAHAAVAGSRMTAARVTLGGTVDRYHVGTMGVFALACFVALSSLGAFAARQRVSSVPSVASWPLAYLTWDNVNV